MKRVTDASASRRMSRNICISDTNEDMGGSRQSSITTFFDPKPKQQRRKSMASNENIKLHVAKLHSKTPPRQIATDYSSPSFTNSNQHAPKRRNLQQQTYLDFGQKSFGKKTLCQLCGMLFDERLPEDAKQHSWVCKEFVQGVPFQAEAARVVSSINENATIIEIRPSDGNSLHNKVTQVRAIVDNELGFVQSEEVEKEAKRWIYFYIITKRIVGMASAERIQYAYELLENNVDRAQEKQKAMVGIHQIWVHSKFRGQKIASRLVDAIREKAMYGCVIPRSQVAFSSPTLAGATFARSYNAADADSKVLVYDCK
ncbi:hypothetical protein MPSEU_000367500 [Mayamaea pseudoterrestris]|nr:hypothetical protein MPSEU_000367500 [Mayamaea pseudoterrestris]